MIVRSVTIFTFVLIKKPEVEKNSMMLLSMSWWTSGMSATKTNTSDALIFKSSDILYTSPFWWFPLPPLVYRPTLHSYFPSIFVGVVIWPLQVNNCGQASVYKHLQAACVVLQVSDPYKRTVFTFYSCWRSIVWSLFYLSWFPNVL
jgi:hypothetical protein